MDATPRTSSSSSAHEARAYPTSDAVGADPGPSAAKGHAEAYANPAGNAGASPGGSAEGNGSASPADALKDIGARLGEVKEYASYLIATKIDGIKATIRNIAIFALLGIVGLIVGTAVLVTAAVLLLNGLAGAINGLLRTIGWEYHSGWAGPLLVGLLILGGLAAGVIFGMRYLTRTFKSQLVAKYEERQRQQRNNFGHDVGERAAHQRAQA